MKPNLAQLVLVCLPLFAINGCIKGPLWRSGYISPWARQRWADEERIAPTIFSKRSDLQSLVNSANAGSPSDRAQAAEQLATIAQKDSTLLVRIEAVKLLGELDTPEARTALLNAAQNPQSEIRMAAVQACAQSTNPELIQILQQVLGGDTDIDVRLAATRALQNHKGPQAVEALALGLEDPNPALQLRAADALQIVTGEKLGRDVRAWREYVQKSSPPSTAITPPLTAELQNGPLNATR